MIAYSLSTSDDTEVTPNDVLHAFLDGSRIVMRGVNAHTAARLCDNNDVEGLRELVDSLSRPLANLDKSTNGRVTFDGKSVLFDGQPMDEFSTNKVLALASRGLSVRPVLCFLEKLGKNPSHRTVTHLFKFLEYGGFPLTESGNVIAYKAIRNDWMDIHSGSFNNAPGEEPSMPRNQVNDDPSVACSRGLHIGTYEYAVDFARSDSRIVAVEFDPADVVCIPFDYNFQKIRACKYRVLHEVVTKFEDDSDDMFLDDYANAKHFNS